MSATSKKTFNSNKNNTQGVLYYSMSHKIVLVNPKRRASDEDLEDLNSPSHSSKRSADSKNQPRLSESLTQKTFRLSGSLPNLELPNALEKLLLLTR